MLDDGEFFPCRYSVGWCFVASSWVSPMRLGIWVKERSLIFLFESRYGIVKFLCACFVFGGAIGVEG